MESGAGRMSSLTPRELELYDRLITADTWAEIAAAMNVAVGTAKVMASRVYDKLKVAGRVELMSREIELWQDRYRVEIAKQEVTPHHDAGCTV